MHPQARLAPGHKTAVSATPSSQSAQKSVKTLCAYDFYADSRFYIITFKKRKIWNISTKS